MSVEAASALVGWLGVYFGVGLVFALAFELFALARLDPAARGAGIGFRLMIFPGLAALWPIMLALWAGAAVKRSAR